MDNNEKLLSEMQEQIEILRKQNEKLSSGNQEGSKVKVPL